MGAKLVAIGHFIVRFVIRLGRIGIGATVGIIGISFCAKKAVELLDVPFARQSFLGIIIGLCFAGGIVFCFWLGFSIAFGDAPKKQP